MFAFADSLDSSSNQFDFFTNLSAIWDFVKGLLLFFYNLIKFMGSLITSLFNWLYRAFVSIWTGDFIDPLYNTFNLLVDYLGYYNTLIFMALFIIAILFIIGNFIIRLFSRRVHYDATLRKLEKSNRTKH